MKAEQLIKANEIQSQILKLKNAKDDAIRVQKLTSKDLYLLTTIGQGYKLLSSVLPIPLDNFIEMYILSIDKKIAELEKEFEML